MENLTSSDAYKLLTEGIIHVDEDLIKDENRWIRHCIYVGIGAKRIADKLGLDRDYAMALGLIHDIGRRISHPNHPLEGYNYMTSKGYVKEAGICLTHSFIDNDITVTAGGGPKNEEVYHKIDTYLKANPPTLYDNIIQLCDLFCSEKGFTTIEKRLLDITNRKGVFANSLDHFNKTNALRERIEGLMNCNLYSLFPEINQKDLESVNSDHDTLLGKISDLKSNVRSII